MSRPTPTEVFRQRMLQREFPENELGDESLDEMRNELMHRALAILRPFCAEVSVRWVDSQGGTQTAHTQDFELELEKVLDNSEQCPECVHPYDHPDHKMMCEAGT